MIRNLNVIKFDLPCLEAEFARTEVVFTHRVRYLVDSQVIYHKCEPRTLEAAYQKYCGKEMVNVHRTEEDARESIGIIKAFSKRGVPTAQHMKLIQVCKKMDDPDFINASLELVRIEEKEKISYDEAVAKYNKIVSQLPLKQNELTRTQTQLNSLNNSVAEKSEELQIINAQVGQSQKNAEVNRETLEQNYEAKRQQLQVKQEEVGTVAQVKAELKKDNLDIETFAVIVKEYRSDTCTLSLVLPLFNCQFPG